MGAKPLYALNIVGFPSGRLASSILSDILRGAADKCAEAGISIIGGHTVEDTEPKFGLAVTGIVHPARVWKNSGAKEGDVLVLTKALGTGILATGLKRGLADVEDGDEMLASMLELNRAAAEAAEGITVHACTDITGFGLLGHLLEITASSKVTAEICASKTPILDAARRLAESGVVPGGTRANLEFVEPRVRFEDGIPESVRWLLADAQTSGGLLFAVSESDAGPLLDRLAKSPESQAQCIGRITGRGPGTVVVTR
jgi:selenide,water dikinase